jgi:hypothetical protein
MDIFLQRRFWAAIIPPAVLVAGAFGIPITEELLTGTLEKLVALAPSVLALWSLLQPKPPAA